MSANLPEGHVPADWCILCPDMLRSLRYLAFFFFVAIGVAQTPSDATRTVILPITIIGKDSKPLPSGFVPTKEMLLLKEDGKPVEVVELKPVGDVPRRIVILFDASASGRAALVGNKRAATVLIQSVLRPGVDSACLAVFNQTGSGATEFIKDTKTLIGLIERIGVSGSTPLFDNLDAVLRERVMSAQTRDPHMSDYVFVITDGDDTTSKTTRDEVERTAQMLKTSLNFITLENERDRGRGRNIANEFASNTGGLTVLPIDYDNIDDQVRRFERELAQRFLLTYHTNRLPAQNNKAIDLKIELAPKVKNVVVRMQQLRIQ